MVPKLNEELIRKRAEHNDGILPDLEEISLHQEELEKIESLEQCCRHLKILLIQGNAIGKLENLGKLKELEYLNISLNNISKIENIEGCESLRKLDMTLNFVDLDVFKESIYNLKANEFLEDFYLLGNPCADFTGYKEYIIAHLPQLKQLDGQLIQPQDKIFAAQQLEEWEKELEIAAEKVREKKRWQKETGWKPSETAHAPETRVTMAREMAAQKKEKDDNEKRRLGTEKKPPREIPGVYNANGDIRQCNEPKYRFKMDDNREEIVLEIETPKHLETAFIDVDVHPNYVRIVSKEKLTQLKLPDPVDVSESKVQRSKATGFLKITMPKAKIYSENGDEVDALGRRKRRNPKLDPNGDESPVDGRLNRGTEAYFDKYGLIRKDKNSEISGIEPLKPDDGEGEFDEKKKGGVDEKKKTSSDLLKGEKENKSHKITNIFELHRDPIAREDHHSKLKGTVGVNDLKTIVKIDPKEKAREERNSILKRNEIQSMLGKTGGMELVTELN